MIRRWSGSAAIPPHATSWEAGSTWPQLGAGVVLLAGVLLMGYLLVHAPFLVTGVIFGALILAAVLARPLVVVAVMLAIGPVDLSFITGGFKNLLPAIGGLDMNGIRLIAISAGLGILALVNGRVLRDIFGRWGVVYVLFLAVAALGLPRSLALVDGLRLWLKLTYPFLIFGTVLAMARTRAELVRLVDWALIGAAIIVFVVNPFYVLAGGYRVTLDGAVRVMGVGTHENPFSFYLMAMLLVALSRFVLRGQWRYLVLCAGTGFWIVLSLTRITFLATLVGLVVLALFAALAGRNWRALGAAGLIAAGVAVPLTPAVLRRSLGFVPTVSELVSLAASPLALYTAINWQGREVVWPIVFAAYLGQPWFGLGLGSSTAIVRANFPIESGQVVHNEYLRLLTDTGALGLAIFALALLMWLWGVARAGMRSDPVVREFAFPAAALLFSWAVVSITDNPFDYYAPFTQYVALLCAGALAAVRLPRDEGEEEEAASRA